MMGLKDCSIHSLVYNKLLNFKAQYIGALIVINRDYETVFIHLFGFDTIF
jgi:hypothetical protein